MSLTVGDRACGAFVHIAIAAAIGAASCGPVPTPTPTPAINHSRPVVGAIRWDAWIGDAAGSDVGQQVERSLGPERWHIRLPFYGREISRNQVHVRGNRQEVMDREIAYASAAGLDYWAFVMYAEDSPLTLGGLDLYLRSATRSRIRFAMIVQSYTFDEASIDRLVHYFRDQRYQRVAGGRPLVFLTGPRRVADPEWPNAAAAVARLRQQTARAGLEPPTSCTCGDGEM